MKRNSSRVSVEKRRGNTSLQNLDIDGRIILMYTLNKYDMEAWL
jgi:hypothetical protein